jgi:hypothetical protein
MALYLGCSDSRPYACATLDGEVSIDGRPVAQGNIEFLPQEADRGPAAGAAIENGRYRCTTVPLGQVLVKLHALEPTGQVDRVGDTAVPVLRSVIPPAAREGMLISVAGDSTQNFHLRSDSGAPSGGGQ